MRRRQVVQSLMRIIIVVSFNPLIQFLGKGEGVVPVVSPDQIFFEGSDDAFGVTVALGIRPSGEDLFDAQDRTIHHESLGCGLTAIVGDEQEGAVFERLTNTVGESAVNSAFDGLKPVVGSGLNAQRITDDFFGTPIKNDA